MRLSAAGRASSRAPRAISFAVVLVPTLRALLTDSRGHRAARHAVPVAGDLVPHGRRAAQGGEGEATQGRHAARWHARPRLRPLRGDERVAARPVHSPRPRRGGPAARPRVPAGDQHDPPGARGQKGSGDGGARGVTPSAARRQTILLSATLTKGLKELAGRSLTDYATLQMSPKGFELFSPPALGADATGSASGSHEAEAADDADGERAAVQEASGAAVVRRP